MNRFQADRESIESIAANSDLVSKPCNKVRCLTAAAFALVATVSAFSQDRLVTFDVDAPGEDKSIETWGLDTAWLWDVNVIRGVEFMGKPQVDVIRFSFTGDEAIVDGDLEASRQEEFDERMRIVDTYTEADTQLYFNNDSEGIDPYFQGDNGINPERWAELIDLTRRKAEEAGRTVISVAPFNEPDFAENNLGNAARLKEVADILRNGAQYKADWVGIRLSGGNTLNNDVAISYYSPNKDVLDEGATHQLAGTFDTYASFLSYVTDQGDWATNDELHNVMEAMVGAEYGMRAGIWWGTAEYARGEFVKTSDGKRLGYAEHRANWTAASVYRAPSGKVQGFVGESERQSRPTSYLFVSKDRDVYFDGVGPQRAYSVRTTGGAGYQTTAHHNAERVVHITWGEDIQPEIDGRYTLVNRQSGKVMEVENGSSENGANVQQGEPSGSNHQSWFVNPVSNTIGGDWSYYSIKPFHDNLKSPDVWNWNIEAGADVRQYEYGGGTNQQWVFEYVENGYFTIRSRYSGKYLEVANGSVDAGANIQLEDGTGEYNQQWRMVPAGAAVEFEAPATPTGLTALANAASVELVWNANEDSDLKGYNIYRMKDPEIGYELIARNIVGNSYVDSAANQSGVSYSYYLKAADLSLNLSEATDSVDMSPSGGQARLIVLEFEQSVEDSSGNGNDLETSDVAGYVAGKEGENSLYFNGATFYASLPATIADFDALTIATWVYWSGSSNDQRILDFSDGADASLFLTPQSSNGELRFALSDGDLEQALTGPALSPNTWTHVAVTLDGTEGRLYVNGELSDSDAITLKPSDIGSVLNYLGKSATDAGPMFAGRLDRFEIYNFAVDANAMQAVIGAAVPPTVENTSGEVLENKIRLLWNSVPGAETYSVKRSVESGGPYETIASGLTAASYEDEELGGGNRFYYLISAVNSVGSGTDSEEFFVSAVPPSEEWRILHFNTTENVGDAADDADPDLDGIVNFLERAFGGDPNVPDVEILPRADSTQPVLSILYRTSLDASDLEIVVQESVELMEDWESATGESEVLNLENRVEKRRFTRSLDGEDVLFLRVKVAAE